MGPKNLLYGIALGAIGVLILNAGSNEWSSTQDSQQKDGWQKLDVQQSTLIRSLGTDRPMVTPVAVQVSTASQSDAQIKINDNSADNVGPKIVSGDLRRLLKQSTQSAKYRPATQRQLADFQKLFLRTLEATSDGSAGLIPADLIQQWYDGGWQVHQCPDDVWVVSELPSQRSGRGIYAVRQPTGSKSRSNLVLQAPHRFHDEGSGLITRKLFQEHPIRVAAWNSVHRRQVDLAHCNDHYINAMTRAMVMFDRECKIVQLHGFDVGKYASGSHSHIASAKLIISDGTSFPARDILHTAASLKSTFGGGSVLLFPDELAVLGGTQNEQAKLMRNLASHRFLHVEMTRDFRDQMTANSEVRQGFFGALGDR